MTRRSRLTRLEEKQPAPFVEPPERFAMRLRQMNMLLGKYGIPALKPDEFKQWGDEVQRWGSVQAWIDARIQGRS